MIGAAAGGAAGVVLGGLYFGGLWITLTRVGSARRPGLLLVGSYALRLAVSAVGFGLLASLGIVPAAAGLAGFLVARGVMIGRLRPDRGEAAPAPSPAPPDCARPPKIESRG